MKVFSEVRSYLWGEKNQFERTFTLFSKEKGLSYMQLNFLGIILLAHRSPNQIVNSPSLSSQNFSLRLKIFHTCENTNLIIGPSYSCSSSNLALTLAT